MFKIFIKENEIYSNPIKFVLNILSSSLNINIHYLSNLSQADIVFDHTSEKTHPINVNFYTILLLEKKFDYSYHFDNKPIIYFINSEKPDWIGTSFYMINCFQEYSENSNNYDSFGRFKFTSSYQYRFNCNEDNLVLSYFLNFCNENKITTKPLLKSQIFLSHDIDSLNGSFLQDGLWAFKNKKFNVLFNLVLNEIKGKPEWKNIKYINQLHVERNLVSTFFWLATNKVGSNKIKNADYNFTELKNLSSLTTSNGLHKSCLNTTLNEELDFLPFPTKINRYHFLKFNLPKAWLELEESRITLDASLGFAEMYGFRNNFGLPFKPYNIIEDKIHSFVEVPLNLMDGTFQKYLKIPVEETANLIIDFIEKNKYGCVISLLWHNTFFTYYKYKGYLDEYLKVLNYLKDEEITTISIEQMH